MEHEEIQSLLGAYALDAVDALEAELIEAHLHECPRCEAEVVAYREVASLLGNSTSEAPAGGWDQLAGRLSGTDAVPSWPEVQRHLPVEPRLAQRRRTVRYAGAGLLAMAAVALILLGLRVSNLDTTVQKEQALHQGNGLTQVVAQALASRHQNVVLTSADHLKSATVVVAPNGEAYWVSSSLPRLAAGKTYQLWALSRGNVVSLGIIGNARDPAAFLLQPTMSELMVTAEPTGGTPRPTTPVLVSAPISI